MLTRLAPTPPLKHYGQVARRSRDSRAFPASCTVAVTGERLALRRRSFFKPKRSSYESGPARRNGERMQWQKRESSRRRATTCPYVRAGMFHVKRLIGKPQYLVGPRHRIHKLCTVHYLDQQKHQNYTKSAHYNVEKQCLL